QLKGREKELASQMKEREKQRQKVALAVSAAIRRELEEAKRREDANKKKLIEDQKKAQAKNDVATNNSKPKTNTDEPVTGVTTAA
ncbi:hypothetical protein ABTC08_19615, partial [Acinetobacter baumannii]